MAHSLKTCFRNSHYLLNITQPVKCVTRHYPIRVLASGFSCQRNPLWEPVNKPKQINLTSSQIANCFRYERNFTSDNGSSEPPKKLSLFQRFKHMYKNYWYVLVPVHMATSAVWLGAFYYTVRSGVDFLGLLEYVGVKEEVIKPLRDSTAGYFALTFALYKIATPLRYAVTLGGTTYTIKKLTSIGLIKPVPSRERLKEILQERRDNLQDRFSESRQHYHTQMKEQGAKVIDEMRRYKTEMRNIKNKVKKM